MVEKCGFDDWNVEIFHDGVKKPTANWTELPSLPLIGHHIEKIGLIAELTSLGETSTLKNYLKSKHWIMMGLLLTQVLDWVYNIYIIWV